MLQITAFGTSAYFTRIEDITRTFEIKNRENKIKFYQIIIKSCDFTTVSTSLVLVRANLNLFMTINKRRAGKVKNHSNQ